MRRTRRRKETTPRSCWGRELAAPPCSPTEPEWVCVCVFAWLNKWLVGVSRFRIGDSPVTSRALGLFSSSEILDLFVWEDENQNFVPNWIQSWRCLSLTPGIFCVSGEYYLRLPKSQRDKLRPSLLWESWRPSWQLISLILPLSQCFDN